MVILLNSSSLKCYHLQAVVWYVFCISSLGKATPEVTGAVNWELSSCECTSQGCCSPLFLHLGLRKRKVMVGKVMFNSPALKSYKNEYFRKCGAIQELSLCFLFGVNSV